MTCEEFRADVDALALGALDADEASAMRSHLATCSACATAYRASRDVAGRLLFGVPQVRAPAGLREAVLAATRADMAPLPGQHEAALAEPPAADPDSAARTVGLLRWLRVRVRVPLVAAAAAAVLIIGLAVWSVAAQVRTQDLQRSRDRARFDAASAQSAAAGAKAAARQMTALLAMPHTVTAGLQPQPAWSALSGAVIWNPEQRQCMVITRGLTPLTAGREYHLWFVAGSATWDGGVLSPDDAGTAAQSVSMAGWPVQGGYVVTVNVESPGDEQYENSDLPVLSATLVSPAQ